MTKKEENWLMHYEELRKYLDLHEHLPDKHVVENRRLLNWVKYQRKRMKEELMPEEQRVLFDELLASRSAEHTGGRRKNQ